MMERHTWKAAAGMDTLGIEPRASRMLSGCVPLHHVPMSPDHTSRLFTTQTLAQHSVPLDTTNMLLLLTHTY